MKAYFFRFDSSTCHGFNIFLALVMYNLMRNLMPRPNRKQCIYKIHINMTRPNQIGISFHTEGIFILKSKSSRMNSFGEKYKVNEVFPLKFWMSKFRVDSFCVFEWDTPKQLMEFMRILPFFSIFNELANFMSKGEVKTVNERRKQ